jgi:hypothetical protein
MATVSLKNGSEGPAHDPYGYREWIVKKNGHKIVGHFGLACWVKVDGRRVADDESSQQVFEREVGVSLSSLERAYERLHNPGRCTSCGGKELDTVDGFPGETLVTCARCGEVVSCDFDESAII